MASPSIIPRLLTLSERASTSSAFILKKDDILQLPIDPGLREELHNLWGMPYIKGAETSFRGFDCSGFAWWVCEASQKQKSENRDYHRASSEWFIRWGTKKPVEEYFKKKQKTVYPVVLAVVDEKKNYDHSVVVYGTVMLNDKKYYIVAQSGQYKGVGHDDGSVSVTLMREDVFLKKFGAFQVYVPQLARALAKKEEPVALVR